MLNLKVKKEGGKAFSSSIRKHYIDKYNIEIGYGSYGGCFDSNKIPSGTIFGNYCSIAQDVKIFRANHPLESFTLHPLFYNPVMGHVKEDLLVRKPIIIGHDVWIGANCIITPSVMKIGNGAVLGAGSVVTKDVPPYAVVAGNPAKIIKYRFNEYQIAQLEESKWWSLSKDELIDKKDYFDGLVNEKK